MSFTTLTTAAVAAAASGTSYLQAITNLKGVLLGIAAAIGSVLVVYGGIRFAVAFQKLDQNGEHQAMYTIAAGGILVGLASLITLL